MVEGIVNVNYFNTACVLLLAKLKMGNAITKGKIKACKRFTKISG